MSNNIIKIHKIIAVLVVALLASCGSSKENTIKNNSKEYIGQFQSVKGVMNNLSCYCYNAGFLTLEDGSEFSICFKDGDIEINCTKLSVTGEFEIVAIEDNPMSACSQGERKILVVNSYKCVD